jgi:hypothetical protein
MGHKRKECSRLLSIVVHGATIISATSSTQAELSVSSFGRKRAERDFIPSCPRGREPHTTHAWSKTGTVALIEAGSERQKVQFTEQSAPGFQSAFRTSQGDVVASSVSSSKQGILVNGICFSAKRVQIEQTITWVVDRIANTTWHDELLRDGSESVIVTLSESSPDERYALDFPSPSPASPPPPPRRVAPVAPTFFFHNHVPTPSGPASEFGIHESQQDTLPWHRLQKKRSRNKCLRKWIHNAQTMQSWKLEENEKALGAEDNAKKGFTPDWGENNLDALFAAGTSLLHAANVPSLSRLTCSKEWEQAFAERNRAAMKFASEMNSGLSPSRDVSQTGNKSW